MEKARHIKAILCDVDGVLTNGSITYDNEGNELKQFNVKDGLIVSHLRKRGFLVGIITGRHSQAVLRRCQELQLDIQYLGVSNKLACYEQIKQQFSLSDQQIAYIGDDLNDLAILSRCGFSACPADARWYIQQQVDFVSESRGGEGVLRDVADYVLMAQGMMEALIKEALQHDVFTQQQ